MQKRRIGNTDIVVSALGLGTVKFGRNQGVKYPAAFQLPTDAEIKNLLALAHDLEINLLDTAPAYGVSEERIGKCLAGNRQAWVISTKAGEEFINGQSHYDFSASAITNSVERSLQRLGTDYLDIVLIHSNGDDERIIKEDNVFATLALLKSAGKIRSYGMSTKTVQGGLLSVDNADVVMVTYNCEATDDREVIQYAHQKQKGIFIKKAFASGHLHDNKQALRFVLQEPGVSSVVIGTINAEHLRENAEGLL